MLDEITFSENGKINIKVCIMVFVALALWEDMM